MEDRAASNLLLAEELFHRPELHCQVLNFSGSEREYPIFTLAQHYGDRGDAVNAFDELKNQWGWLGYTTHDHARSEMMTLFVALAYNWSRLFTRLSFPHKRAEAITSRPLLLHAIGRKTSHSNQSTLTLTSLHAEAATIQVAMKAVAGFLGHLRSITEQLKSSERWKLILRSVVRAFPLRRAMKMPSAEFQTAQ